MTPKMYAFQGRRPFPNSPYRLSGGMQPLVSRSRRAVGVTRSWMFPLRRGCALVYREPPRRRCQLIVAWHRNAFRRYWTAVSSRPGRPRIALEVRKLVVRMARENPTWVAARIHGELLKLGFHISERTVSRCVPRLRPRKGSLNEWLTCLRNHRELIGAMNFSRCLQRRSVSCTSCLSFITGAEGFSTFM